MGTQGNLTDFPLSAIFKWVEQGRKTGVLAIRPLSVTPLASNSRLGSNLGAQLDQAKNTFGENPTLQPDIKSKLTTQNCPYCYIWIAQGRIVAAANRFDGKALISLLRRDQWVSDRVLSKVLQRYLPRHQPLGIWLKNQGILEQEQLEQIFQIQIVELIVPLFQLKDAQFKFESNISLPNQEMTGLSISATEASVMGSGRLQCV